MAIIRVVSFLVGLGVVFATLSSAVRTLVLPRSAPDKLTGVVFMTMRRLFNVRLHRAGSYAERDRVMALYAPVSLIALPPTWLVLVLIGFMGMFWAVGIEPWSQAFTVSGSSLLTLGFARGDTLPQTILAFTEATIGLILVALLIAYLPTMYGAFSRREIAVNLLGVRAGTPPSAIEMLMRFDRLNRLDQLHDSWETWEAWFADLEESHTSLAALVFFRSPQPEQAWITAAGAVLDAASLASSTLDVPPDPQAALCIRAGFLALCRIADYFGVPYNPDPHFPDDPISVTREEFGVAYDQMAGQGVPLKPDREEAWGNFAGWRVNYDKVLIALCALTMAPEAPWSADRAPAFEVPPLVTLGRRGVRSR
jgi:hypothetical protein